MNNYPQKHKNTNFIKDSHYSSSTSETPVLLPGSSETSGIIFPSHHSFMPKNLRPLYDKTPFYNLTQFQGNSKKIDSLLNLEHRKNLKSALTLRKLNIYKPNFTSKSRGKFSEQFKTRSIPSHHPLKTLKIQDLFQETENFPKYR
jgi:hypothetical protein